MIPTLLEKIEVECLAKCDYAKTGQKWNVFLRPEMLPKAAARLDETGFYIVDVCAVDAEEGLVVTYHFDHFAAPNRVTLRVLVSRELPEVPSIVSVYPGADWHERETRDFHGIVFTGHPNLVPLLLPDDADFHPLLKDDASRTPLRTYLERGEAVRCRDGFALFDEPAVEPAAEAKAEEGGETA